MDLLSSIRKSGSRGGVNFSWDEVSTSQHRENYLGHSLMAPVGRWQKGRDLNWYAKGDDEPGVAGETAEERKSRERKEEIRRIKEAEEDALARALGLPVTERTQTGANAVSVGEMKRVMKEVADENGDEEIEVGRGFGDFVGKLGDEAQPTEGGPAEPEKGGLLMKDGGKKREGRRREESREQRHRHRHRSRSGDRERRRHRSRSGDRHGRRQRYDDERRKRSRSPDRKERRRRSRSGDRHRARREDREPRRDDREPRRDDREPRRDDRELRRDDREPRRDLDRRPRRSRSPDFRDSRLRRD